MRAIVAIVGCLLGLSAAAKAPEVAEPPLDEVVVTGEYPGPGMWKVSRTGDATGHTLWIVGEPFPLPKDWKWKSRAIEATAAGAQEIIWDANFNLTTDEKVGVFRGLTLVRAALKARHNPDGARLADLLPAELYARWQAQKMLYLGKGDGLETWRPMFVAEKLREAAIDELGLRRGGPVSEVIYKLARKNKTRMTGPQLRVTFKRSEIRDRLKQFSRESLADVECLEVTLDLVEALARRDIEDARARAWARGDLEALARFAPLPDPDLPCGMAILTSEVARDLVPADLSEQLIGKWLEAVDAGVTANQSTFAIVDLGKLTRPGGYLERLAARGYTVELLQ